MGEVVQVIDQSVIVVDSIESIFECFGNMVKIVVNEFNKTLTTKSKSKGVNLSA